MADSDDEAKIRKRIREREDEFDERMLEEKRKAGKLGASSSRNASLEKLEELLVRADPLIDQVNNLYNIYFSGVDKIPPVERRKNLDQVMSTLQVMAKPTPSALYRYSAVHSKYESYRDRWDRMLKQLETGKAKRRVGSSSKG